MTFIARLLVVHGPQKGAVFVLEKDEIDLGRESANHIEIRDLSVSRRHCVLRRRDTGFLLTGMESTNGTRINGIPVTERLLVDGDDITIGDTTLRFLMQSPEVLPVPIGAADFAIEDTARVSVGGLEELGTRGGRQLRTLLQLHQALAAATDQDAIEHCFLEAAMAVTGATRAACLRYQPENPEQWRCCTAFDSSGWRTDAFAISSSILKEIGRSRSALLIQEVRQARQLSASVRSAGIRSLIALPIVASETLLGALYLDSSGLQFDNEHMEWLVPAAGMVAITLAHVSRIQSLKQENLQLKAQSRLRHSLVGNSAPMREVYARIAKIAASDTTVLIFGESGTGKELAARAIHENSSRHSKAFVAVNCALLNDSLLESDLFGHEKGAFTGAIQQKRGKLELAEGGTLFLDELGELSPGIQAKLLRVFQERQFERLGGTRVIPADVRIIGATHRDLEQAVADKSFRHDLYFRLKVVTLNMPPLRERRDDIPALTAYLMSRCAKRTRRRVESIEPEAMQLLIRHNWQGNVRELENTLESALVMGEDAVIRARDLPESLFESEADSPDGMARFYRELNKTKQRIIRDALEECGWSYTQAASALGINRTYLHRLVRSLGIKPPESMLD